VDHPKHVPRAKAYVWVQRNQHLLGALALMGLLTGALYTGFTR
jgi:hypothetical protein